MNEKLKVKIETIAEHYADLIDVRIQKASNAELCDTTVMTEINEGIRMLHHAVAALERIDRMDHGDETDSLF